MTKKYKRDGKMFVRLETGQEDRISQEFGPFSFVQITYSSLRVGPDGETLAIYDQTQAEWRATPMFRKQAPSWWSDVVIYTR